MAKREPSPFTFEEQETRCHTCGEETDRAVTVGRGDRTRRLCPHCAVKLLVSAEGPPN